MYGIPPLNSFLKWKLGFQSPSLAFAAKPNSRPVILTVAIPYHLLKAWRGFMTELKRGSDDIQCPIHNDTSDSSHITFVDLFEHSIHGNIFAICDDEDMRKEVYKSLAWLQYVVEYRKAKGSAKKEQLNTKSSLFHLFEGMVIYVKELKMESEIMKDELEQWKENCQNIPAKMQQLL